MLNTDRDEISSDTCGILTDRDNLENVLTVMNNNKNNIIN